MDEQRQWGQTSSRKEDGDWERGKQWSAFHIVTVNIASTPSSALFVSGNEIFSLLDSISSLSIRRRKLCLSSMVFNFFCALWICKFGWWRLERKISAKADVFCELVISDFVSGKKSILDTTPMERVSRDVCFCFWFYCTAARRFDAWDSACFAFRDAHFTLLVLHPSASDTGF